MNRLCDRCERLNTGLDIIREGGRYRDAATAAGYSSEANFSRACVEAFGARPLAIIQRERQERAA